MCGCKATTEASDNGGHRAEPRRRHLGGTWELRHVPVELIECPSQFVTTAEANLSMPRSR